MLTSLAGLFAGRLFLSRGLIAFFLFASFGTLWSGLTLPLAAALWHLSAAPIGLFGIARPRRCARRRPGRTLGRFRTGQRRHRGGALALLAVSWLAIGHTSWSLWPAVIGVRLRPRSHRHDHRVRRRRMDRL
ncbi:hypothetical protein [Saccharopolyspora sp. NPDC002376]